MTEKYGFSVVAASSVIVRSSTAASSESCWVLENRCTSSMNSTVGAAPERRARRAVSITARTSFTPADSAESATNCRFAAEATRWAMVVLPVPGGPHRIVEIIAPAVDQLAQWPPPGPAGGPARRVRPGWPGRIRTASGASGAVAVKSARPSPTSPDPPPTADPCRGAGGSRGNRASESIGRKDYRPGRRKRPGRTDRGWRRCPPATAAARRSAATAVPGTPAERAGEVQGDEHQAGGGQRGGVG